jgi:SAM-dependent methyltransferase
MPAGSGDRWPDDYERGRPGWPREAVVTLELAPTATVLDLGAGTGKLTRELVPEFERVIAVEPAEAMRRLLATHCPTVDARAGDARAIPLERGSVDAVFAAQSFHWFDDDAALGEIARVLRTGGALALLWNLPAGPWDPPTTAAEAVLQERLPQTTFDHDPLDLGGPHRTDGWPGLFAAAGFEPPEQVVITHGQTLDRDGLVAYFASMGWIADLADDERVPLLAEVGSRLDHREYRRTWATHLYRTRLLAS